MGAQLDRCQLLVRRGIGVVMNNLPLPTLTAVDVGDAVAAAPLIERFRQSYTLHDQTLR